MVNEKINDLNYFSETEIAYKKLAYRWFLFFKNLYCIRNTKYYLYTYNIMLSWY